MNKGFKLVYLGAALAAFTSLALQGCGSDSDDSAAAAGTGGSAGSTAGNGGSSGSTAGNGGSSGSTAGNGGSSGSTAGNGGSSGSTAGTGGAGTGGQAGVGGEAGAGTGGVTSAECATLTYPTPNPTCADFCSEWFGASTCSTLNAAKYANNDACMADCASFTATQMCCRDEHVHNAESTGNPTLHCPHAAGVGLCQN